MERPVYAWHMAISLTIRMGTSSCWFKNCCETTQRLRGVQSQHAFPFVHLQSAGQFRCSELDSGLPEGSVVSGVWARQLGRP